jgi:hypothetical protein
MDACTPECSNNEILVTKPLTASFHHFFENEEKSPPVIASFF